jgi:arylsulfatase A-like enzyme
MGSAGNPINQSGLLFFRSAGYATSLSGKSHVGSETACLPQNQAFDTTLFIDKSNNLSKRLWHGDALAEPDVENRRPTERFTTEAVRFILEKRATEHPRKDLLLWHGMGSCDAILVGKWKLFFDRAKAQSGLRIDQELTAKQQSALARLAIGQGQLLFELDADVDELVYLSHAQTERIHAKLQLARERQAETTVRQHNPPLAATQGKAVTDLGQTTTHLNSSTYPLQEASCLNLMTRYSSTPFG